MSTVTSEVIIYVNIICASDRNRCESRQPDYRDECKPSRSETFPDAKSDHRRNHRRVCISLHPGRPIDYWKFSRIYQYCRLPDYDILRALLSLAVPRFRQCSGNLRKSGPKRHFLPKRRAGRQLHSPSFSAGVMNLSPLWIGASSMTFSCLSMWISGRMGQRLLRCRFFSLLAPASAILLILIGIGELLF